MNEPYDSPAPETSPLSWRDWAGPMAALALSALWFSVFGLNRLAADHYAPGIGITAIVAAHFAAVFVFRRHNAPPDRAGLWLMAAALTLAVCAALYSAWPIALVNCLLIFCVSAAATFRLSGHCRRPWDSFRAAGETVALTFRALTGHIGRVFAAIGLSTKRKERRMGALWLGVLPAIALLALVIALLSSADAVFSFLFRSLFDTLAALDLAVALRRGIRCVLLALFLASGLYHLGSAPAAPEADSPAQKGPGALFFLAAAFLLDGVYILFVVIQIACLFGGAESAAMAGGWAEYARSGFFQLVAVAAINLLFCLVSSGGGRLAARGGRTLFWADMFLLALTVVILASSAWRMGLYIRAFGLSLLRLMTLWAMVFIAVLLGAAAVRLIRPQARFGRVFITIGLTTWCLFCLCNPAAMAARYNISAYEAGRLSDLDLPYLEQFYPDTKRPLEAYLERSLDLDRPAPTWSEWRFAFLF